MTVSAAWYEALLAAGDAVTAMDVVFTTSGSESEPSFSAACAAMSTLKRQIGEQRGCGERVYADVDEVVAVDPESGPEVVYTRSSGAGRRVNEILDSSTEVETAVPVRVQVTGGGHWRVGWLGDITTLTDAALAERVTSMTEAIAESVASAEREEPPLDWETDGVVALSGVDEAEFFAAHAAWIAATAEGQRRAEGT